MSHDRLPERIAAVFADTLKVDVPSPEADLFESGVLDSVAFVELLLHLEREFGIHTSADDLEVENFRSITRISAFVAARAEAERPRVVGFGARG